MTFGGSRGRCLSALAVAAALLAGAAAGCGSTPAADSAPAADGSLVESVADSPGGDARGDAPTGAPSCDGGGSAALTGDGGCAGPEADGAIDGGGSADVVTDAAPSVDATYDGPSDADVAGDAEIADGDDVSDASDAWPDGSIVFLDASCPVEIEQPPLLPASHVAIGSTIDWNSNPPSSGPHYPIWAAYQAYTTPVPRGYYVHDLEHGGVVFLYNCGDAGCPDVVAALQAASDAIPDDPLCTSLEAGVRVRTVITPDPLIDVPVAAAAWGWVYKAACADPATLRDFALQHYGQGPEVLCNDGQMSF